MAYTEGFAAHADGHGAGRDLWRETTDQRLRGLSPDQRALLELALAGQSGKAAAFALGRTESWVSRGVAVIARRLGFATRVELLRAAAALLGRDAGPRLAPQIRLTAAEQGVLRLLRTGLSDQAIARCRQTSVHTVRNQISSVLRKTGLPGRKALIVAVLD